MVNERLKWLAGIGFVLALTVVVLGAWTRLVDAGLGCPDWPGCYGFIAVPQTAVDIATAQARFPDVPVEAHKAWPEMVHRYFATTLGLVIVITAVYAWMKRSPGTPVGLLCVLVVLVIVQGAFGAWTVTLKLWPQVVTAHLLGGFATLSLLWLLLLRLGVGAQWRVPRTVKNLAIAALAVVVVQISLGGWVTSNYAALACPDFPTCHGEWLPDMDVVTGFNLAQSVGPNYLGGQLESDARVAIQVFHRLGAVLVLLVAGALSLRLLGDGSPLALVVGGVLLVQLTLGILNVVLTLPLAIATLHNAFGAILLLTIVTVTDLAVRDPSRW